MEKRINFLENKNAVRAFESSTNSKELLFRLSALANSSFIMKSVDGNFKFSRFENSFIWLKDAAAQELKAHGFDLYYFTAKKQGEVDFTVEKDGDVLPIEIKSGKDYQRHAALNNIMSDKNYGKKAYLLYNGNVESVGNIIYLPIYMLMFIEKEPEQTPIIYRFDAGVLKN